MKTVFLTRFTTRETPKPVSQLFGFTSERDRHTQTDGQTDTHTSSNLRLTYTKGPSGNNYVPVESIFFNVGKGMLSPNLG